jgi:hypothetical protein
MVSVTESLANGSHLLKNCSVYINMISNGSSAKSNQALIEESIAAGTCVGMISGVTKVLKTFGTEVLLKTMDIDIKMCIPKDLSREKVINLTVGNIKGNDNLLKMGEELVIINTLVKSYRCLE